MTKYCYKCDTHKPLSDFHKNKARHDGLAGYCKMCAKVRNREYYLSTPERNPQRMSYRKAMVDKSREYVWQYLQTHPCVDCGESDPIVLEFDHVRDVKLYSISDAIWRGMSIEAIKAEIAKCEVRCANDHRRATMSRLNWYRSERQASELPISLTNG